LVENANAWGVSKYHDFCERQIKMAHCKNKIKIELWDALIPWKMDLQEGMVIKGI
jgi:hypothetical protein